MNVPHPVPFDSHRFVKRMTEADMPPAQAEALAAEQSGMVDTHFATKQDTGELKRDVGEIKRQLDNLERNVGELKVGLAAVRAELGMVKWMGSGIGAGMLLLVVQSFWPM